MADNNFQIGEKTFLNEGNWKDAGNDAMEAATDIKDAAASGLKKVGKGALSTAKAIGKGAKSLANGKAASKVAKSIKNGVKTVLDLPNSKNIPPEMLIVPSKIIAKLHLAGKQQVTKSVVINTGIIKDNDNGPDKPGDIDFDLTAKDGTYDLGLVREITYQVDEEGILKAAAEKVQKEVGIDKEIEEISNLNKELGLKDGDAEKIKELETQLSGEGIADDQVKKINDQLSKLKPEGYNDKSKKKQDLQKSAREKLDKYYKETLKRDPKELGDENADPNAVFQQVIKAAQESQGSGDVQSQIAEIRQKKIDEILPDISKDLDAYMKLFAGVKYEKPNVKDIPYVNVPLAFSSKSSDYSKYVKDFKISGFSEDGLKKDKDSQNDKTKGEISENLCFKVQFKIMSQK